MSYQCTNPWVYSGQPGNPPEFRSTAPVTCACCAAEMDADEDSFHLVFGETVCRGCVNSCHLCGEWLDDATFPWTLRNNRFAGGPISIRFRDYLADGKRSKPHCPVCAANWLLEMFTGVEIFEADDYTGKEPIRLLLAANNALPGVAGSKYLPDTTAYRMVS